MIGRLREAFATLDPDHVPGEGCPAPERIWDATHGALPPLEAREVVEHIAACSSCAADWRSVREAEGAFSGPRHAVRARWILAAAALLAGAVFLVTGPWRPRSEPVYREEGPAIRSLVPEDAPLPRDHAVLRWTSPGPDAVFSVEVGRPDLTPVASARDLPDPSYLLPAGALAGIEPGGTIVWRVEARLPDGRRIESPAFLHTLR